MSASEVESGSESEEWELFVSIIELEDLSNLTECLVIFIPLNVEIVK